MALQLRLREMLFLLVCTAILLDAVASLEGDAEITSNADAVSSARKGRLEENGHGDEDLPEPSALVSPQSSKISGLFGGKPFYLEKDPITGVVDFNTKTVKINSSGIKIPTEDYDDGSKLQSSVATQSDHKDTSTDSDTRPNNIIPYKNFPGNLNDFTNLRIQDYSNHKYQNDKFPLISSSYANTKVQGTAGSNKNHNHRPLPTSSTPHPFYYTMGKVTTSARTTSSAPPTTITTITTTTTAPPSASDEEYDEFYEDSQEENEQPVSGTEQHFSVHYGEPQIPASTAFSSTEQPRWPTSAGRPHNNPDTQHSSASKQTDDYEDDDTALHSKQSSTPSTHYNGVQNNVKPAFTLHDQQLKINSNSSQNFPDKAMSSSGQKHVTNATGLHNIPNTNLQFNQHSPEDSDSFSNVSNSNTNHYGLHQWNGFSDNRDSISDLNRNPTGSDYDESEFEGEEAEYEDEEDESNLGSDDVKQEFTKQRYPPLLSTSIGTVSSEPPFRFTTTTSKKFLTTTRPTQPSTSTTQRVTNTTTEMPPSTSSYAPFSQTVATSMPLGTHFLFRPPPLQASLPRQPEQDHFQKPLSQKQNIRTTTIKSIPSEQSPGYLQNLSTNVVVGAGIHEIGTGSVSHKGQNLPAGGHFVSTALNARPYSESADEPFKPIIGPVEKTENEHSPNRETNIVVGAGIGISSGSQFLNHELSSPPKYPSNGGSSSLLKFPSNIPEKYQPPKIPGVEPPRPVPPLIFKAQQVSGHVVFPEDKSSSSANYLVTSQTDVAAAENIPSQGQPSSEDSLPLKVINQPNIQNKPIPGKESIQTPSPYLVPPAKSETSLPSSNWDIHQKLPPIPQNYYPQQNQKARPKVDIILPSANISPSQVVRTKQNSSRRPGIQNHNLPNILPQFRPNTKNSYGQAEHGVRVHQFMQQRPPIIGQRHPVGLVESLQPPPPPPHIRINRNDEAATDIGAEDTLPFDSVPPTPPVMQRRPLFVHRRTGAHTSSFANGLPQVATLQMMQSRPLSRRDDFPDAHHDFAPPLVKYHSLPPINKEDESIDHPVFVVYPVNSAPVNIRGSSDSSGVVVGTRGPQLPLPPSNLETEYNLPAGVENTENSGSVVLTFSHNKDQEPLLQLAKDKHDTPILKSPSKSSQSPLKSEFPYPLEKPNVFITNSDRKSDSTHTGQQKLNVNENLPDHRDPDDHNTPEETFAAEVYNSNVNYHEDNADVNIIPYLQDFMPYATKKPHTTEKNTDKETYNYGNKSNGWTLVDKAENDVRVNSAPNSNKVLLHSASPISVTLRTVQSSSSASSLTTTAQSSGPFRITDNPKQPASPPSHQHAVVGAGGSEFTLSAVVHTQPQENHRPAHSNPASVSSVTSPPALNFQAPFMASANIGTAPTNQGWSVVRTDSNNRAVDRDDLDTDESAVSSANTEVSHDRDRQSTNFDIENFKPELFGGFKPIYTYPEDEASGPPSQSTSEKVQTAEREEKKLVNFL